MKSILIFALFSSSCIGCSGGERDPSLLVDGSYESSRSTNPDLSDVLAGIKLELRTSEMSAKFTDSEGQETEVTFTETPKEDGQLAAQRRLMS